jgi:hypothetical protein
MRNANKKQPASKTPKDWAGRITASWQQAVQSIIQTGRLLIQAKDDLDHGEFSGMELPFSARTAQMLMKIADHPVLSNAKHVSHLPPSWGTLYQLTHLPDEALETLLADGTINCDLERKDAEEIIKKVRDEGLYLWTRLAESLNTVTDFMRKWPDPAKLASRHLVAVIDGVIHDTHDCSRDGTRCVYGYFQPSAEAAAALKGAGSMIVDGTVIKAEP